MTKRLYYDDSYLREFSAQVLDCAPAGERWRVTLDRTAFYPTSGGQPFDTGKLGAANVLDVVDEEDAIIHLLDAPLDPGPVQGSIESARRFDHMQQHTGQHILSAAFVELYDFPTVSFHLGREVCTIDLPQMPAPAQLQAAERRACEIVFASRPVEVLYGTAAELAQLGIRKAVEREGVLRAVAIQDFDRQPCGGTHVRHTGEVGLILLRKVEKQKQNCRIEFVCGQRARNAARNDFATVGEAARLLSCAPSELASGIARAVEEQKAGLKRERGLLEALAKFEARALLGEAAGEPPRRIAKVFPDASADYLRLLATQLAEHPGVQAFLATRATGHVVFAQSPGGAADMNLLLRAALQAHGGRGGGTRDFAQGSVPDAATLDALLRSAAQAE